MLYSKDWDKPKPQPGTWASVIAWLYTKDPEEEYRYCDSHNCLAAQYNRAVGREYDTFKALSSNPFTYFSFDRRLERLARGSMFSDHTFGAALDRAMART